MNIVIDGCIFQLQWSRPVGISRFWVDFIPELQSAMPDDNIVVLQRRGYPVPISNVRIHEISYYALGPSSLLTTDDSILDKACSELGADVFMSSYYTRAPSVKNVLRIHDMIPELLGWDLARPEWVAKRRAIQQANCFVCTSKNTAADLMRLSRIEPFRVFVSYTAAARHFYPASLDEMKEFRRKYRVTRPYFLMVGNQSLYKNGSFAIQAFGTLADKYDLVTVGSDVWYKGVDNFCVQIDWLPDNMMRAAYSGALALVYPSMYEGFGLPVLEGLRCGCPPVVGKVASLPEVAGDVGIYVEIDKTEQMVAGMASVLGDGERARLGEAALIRARDFTWAGVVECYKAVLSKGGWDV